MARGNEGRATFVGQMEVLLRGFSCNVQVNPALDSGFHHALCSPTTPSDGSDGLVRVAHYEGAALQDISNALAQLSQGRRLAVPPPDQVSRAEVYRRTIVVTLRHEFEQPCQLSVIAPFRVCVQRQVESEDIQVVLQSRGDALTLNSPQNGVFIFPEPTMVNQNGVCILLHCGIKQCLGGGNSGNNMTDGVLTFDLQPIRAVIFEALHLQYVF